METNTQDVLLDALDDRWAYAQLMDESRLVGVVEPLNWWVFRETVSGTFRDSPLYPENTKEKIQELDYLALDIARYRLDHTPFPKPKEGFERRPGHIPKGWTRGFLSLDDESYTQYQAGVEIPNRVVLGDKRGWALKLLSQAEIESGKGRWLDWNRSRCDAPIPQLAFGKIHGTTAEYLEYLLSQITENWSLSKTHGIAAVRYLIDWLCWSLAHPSVPEFPNERDYDPGNPDDFVTLEAHLNKQISWDGQAHNRLVAVWNPAYLLLWDSCDWFGWLLNRVGYCSRPEFNHLNGYHNVFFSDLYLGNDTEQFLFIPEITPADVLIASNYTRNLAGSQSDTLLAKAAILTGYFVMPEFVFPNTQTADPDKYLGDEEERWGKLIVSFYQLAQLKGLYTNYFDTTAVVPSAFGYNPIQLRMTVEPTEKERLQLSLAESKVFGSALPPGVSDNAPALSPGATPALPPGTSQKVNVKVKAALSPQESSTTPALPPGTSQKVNVKVSVKQIQPSSAQPVKINQITPRELEPLHTEQEQGMKRVEMLPPGEDDDEAPR